VRRRHSFLERSPGAIAVEIVRSLNAVLEPRTRFGRSDHHPYGQALRVNGQRVILIVVGDALGTDLCRRPLDV
jgi:hypothetical protein